MTQPVSASWHDLVEELDRWADAGRDATFWWRDDDATEPTDDLLRLVGLCRSHGLHLALAVIPAVAGPALGSFLSMCSDVTVLQHGWSHANHAAPAAKKCELGAERPVKATLAELAEGRRVLDGLFGRRALPVLVPPWNRIDPGVVSRLEDIGFTGLSLFGPRRVTPPGLICVNTHADPVAWRSGSGFLGDGAALGMAVSHLRARRLGAVDAIEPTGLLTHHLVMDAATWAFTERFLRTTLAHPAARWLPPETLFGVA